MCSGPPRGCGAPSGPPRERAGMIADRGKAHNRAPNQPNARLLRPDQSVYIVTRARAREHRSMGEVGSMETIPVLEDLTQYQSYVQPIDLSFNQYLLVGKD